MIDLNNAPQQPQQLIPPGSRVLVRLGIVYPDGGRLGGTYPLTASCTSSLESLACTLKVLSPRFQGQTFRHSFCVCGASTPEQHRTVDAARRQIRALIEAACRIHPGDGSPRAVQTRILHAWTDIDGLEFPAVVGVATLPGPGGRARMTNTLKAVITMEEPDYARIRNGGEWISNLPAADVAPRCGVTGACCPQEPGAGTLARPAARPAPAGAAPATTGAATTVTTGTPAGSGPDAGASHAGTKQGRAPLFSRLFAPRRQSGPDGGVMSARTPCSDAAQCAAGTDVPAAGGLCGNGPAPSACAPCAGTPCADPLPPEAPLAGQIRSEARNSAAVWPAEGLPRADAPPLPAPPPAPVPPAPSKALFCGRPVRRFERISREMS